MTKIVINGFGRIGRSTFRRIFDNHPDLEIIVINDLTDINGVNINDVRHFFAFFTRYFFTFTFLLFATFIKENGVWKMCEQ